MNNFLTLYKHLLFYPFRRNDKRTSSTTAVYIVCGVMFALIIASTCASLYFITPVFAEHGILAELLATLMLVSGIVVLFFAFIPTLNGLFFSSDSQFLMSLPIKSQTIFLAKLAVVYTTELLVVLAFIIPCTIVVGISAGLGVVYYITMLLSVFLLPAIPLFIIAVLALPITYFIGLFKNRGALSSIILIVAFAIFFVLYFLSFSSMGSERVDSIDFNAIVVAVAPTLKTLSAIFFPYSALTRLATLSGETLFGSLPLPYAPLVNLAVFVIFMAVVLFVAIFISAKIYRRAVSKITESGVREKAKNISHKSSKSVMSALMQKEWKELIRTPAFAFQCLMGVIIAPLMVFVMRFTGADIQDLPYFSELMPYVSIFIVSMLGCSINAGASTCISREGKNFMFVKTMPVSYDEQVSAKLRLYLIISTLTIVLSLIVFAIVSLDIIHLIFGGMYLLACNYSHNAFGVLYDLTHIKTNWVTPNEIIKQSSNVTVPMLVGMGLTALSVIIAVASRVLIGETVGVIVGYVILTIIYATLGIIFRRKITKQAHIYLQKEIA